MEKQDINEPHIKIFNEDISSSNKNDSNLEKENESSNCSKHSHKHCRKNRSAGVFGLVLLFAGLLLLLNNFGIVSKEIWIYILPFWPVLLIFAGIKIILGSSRIARFFYFIIALVILCFIFINALVRVSPNSQDNLRVQNGFVNIIN